jgi:hypothetical protein
VRLKPEDWYVQANFHHNGSFAFARITRATNGHQAIKKAMRDICTTDAYDWEANPCRDESLGDSGRTITVSEGRV